MTERKRIPSMKLCDLEFAYDGHTPLFSNAHFEFEMGRNYWITGETNSGKSSLLRLLGALSQPQKGQYFIGDENVFEMSFDEFMPYRFSIGYSFDLGGVINNRTVYENLRLPLDYHGVGTPEERHQKVEKLLQLFSIDRFSQVRPAEVTGRVKKLVVVCRAFIFDPQVLLMDEPTVGMTADDVSSLSYLIEEYLASKGLETVIFVSRNEPFVESFDPIVIDIQHHQLKKKVANG